MLQPRLRPIGARASKAVAARSKGDLLLVSLLREGLLASSCLLLEILLFNVACCLPFVATDIVCLDLADWS